MSTQEVKEDEQRELEVPSGDGYGTKGVFHKHNLR